MFEGIPNIGTAYLCQVAEQEDIVLPYLAGNFNL